MATKRAFGISAASVSACRRGTTGSAVPHRTKVGARIVPSHGRASYTHRAGIILCISTDGSSGETTRAPPEARRNTHPTPATISQAVGPISYSPSRSPAADSLADHAELRGDKMQSGSSTVVRKEGPALARMTPATAVGYMYT